MPEFTGKIENGKPILTDRRKFSKWIHANEGLFFKAKFNIPGKRKDKKTLAQLGYYWAVLVPQICEQLVSDGYTITLDINEIHREIPYTKDATHEMLTALCGQVGENGKHLRLSDPDRTLARMIKFISNVLDVAVISLKMNGDNLKAMRPK